MMSEVTCNVIRDILPLYVDGIVSNDTQNMVLEHLEHCSECRKKYESMTSEIELPIENDVKPLENFKRAWKRKKVLLVCSSIVVTIAIIFGAAFVVKQVHKQSLQYCQEYVLGQAGIMGNVDVQEYVDIHEDFAIGANKYGYAVFKEPEKALNTLKELYPNAIALIQSEFSLADLTTDTCQQYKLYGAQIVTGTPEEQEQAHFISKFLDIYENSYFEQ